MSESPNPIALRLDDVGASSKRFEVYSKKSWNFGPLRISGNWFALKYLAPFKAWGPYREMTAKEWQDVFLILRQFGAKLTVGITAAWVEDEFDITPFPKKFPEEANALKEGQQEGLLEIANHGYTHCIAEGNAFKPKLMDGNREQHREFWDHLPAETHHVHLARSQEILESFFQVDVITLVPPGNVYSDKTLQAAEKLGLRVLSCNTTPGLKNGIQIVDPKLVEAFHDRELVLEGTDWLRNKLVSLGKRDFRFVRELAQ
jgi:hypothetical protein